MAFPARIKPHDKCDNIFEDIDVVAERIATEVSPPGLPNANLLFELEPQKPLVEWYNACYVTGRKDRANELHPVPTAGFPRHTIAHIIC